MLTLYLIIALILIVGPTFEEIHFRTGRLDKEAFHDILFMAFLWPIMMPLALLIVIFLLIRGM